jgi:Predicted membrane protein (DUF2232)
MIANLLIALAAGCASALMFASIISGALVSLLLFYLAPLPLMVAALGWGPAGAAIGGIAAGGGLGAIFGIPYLMAFILTVAVPACWLGHLALLGRPATNGISTGNGAAIAPPMEWYPVGRILIWTAGFAVLTTVTALLNLGSDGATISGALKQGLLSMIGPRDTAAAEGDLEQVIDALVSVAPATAAILAIMTLTLNLWLAAKITATSGRLHRPWPDLKTAALPPMTLAALSLAIAFCFTGGLLAIVAQVVCAVLLMSYTLIGFAVLHTLTLALKRRTLWLTGAYAIVLVVGWPMIAIVALGLVDAVFGLRQRYLKGKPPPIPAS